MQHALPDYRTVDEALSDLEAVGGAAETHGLLCAILSSGVAVRPEAWLESMMSKPLAKGDNKSESAYKVLQDLYQKTRTALTEMDDFDLQLLLPNDDSDFSERIEALVQWTQGFLSGLKAMGIEQKDEQGEMKDALSDLNKIACLEYENEIGDEEGEHAYAELVEYTRMAVLLVHDELVTRFGSKNHVKGNKTMH
jgi:hypothetical protein